ncbi:MAG: T9SS type A sorting domain-containing protein [bacterium]|nr:T9SS type A sorting domain-containing protein [bacterium]
MEDGIHQYYAGQPVVTLGLDIYNGSPAAVEVFRGITGVTFPLLTQAGTYSSQNSGDYRKVVIDPDGIVRYVSGPYQLNITTIRSHVDEWLPLDEPTFELVMHETELTYIDGFNTFTYHAELTNLLNEDRQFTLALTPIVSPDPYRGYAICTYFTCLPPDTGYQDMTISYTANQHDTLVSTYIYNMAFNPELGYFDTSTVHGDYQLRFSVFDPANPDEVISYDLYLYEGSAISPRIEPVVTSHALLSNYPNPFNPETTVSFVVNRPGAVTLNVYNMLGQNVATLLNSPFMASGQYSATWNATNMQGLPLPSGNYLLELNTLDARAVHRVVLMR